MLVLEAQVAEGHDTVVECSEEAVVLGTFEVQVSEDVEVLDEAEALQLQRQRDCQSRQREGGAEVFGVEAM